MATRSQPKLLAQGKPWKPVLRRAASEDEARKIFTQAEAALDTESQTPVGAGAAMSGFAGAGVQDSLVARLAVRQVLPTPHQARTRCGYGANRQNG